jgi:hypothetical protein
MSPLTQWHQQMKTEIAEEEAIASVVFGNRTPDTVLEMHIWFEALPYVGQTIH